MKKHLFTIALAILSVSCSLIDKLDDLTKFDIPYDTSFEVKAALPIGTKLNISTPPVKTNSEEHFDINKTAKNLVEEVKLSELTLEITAPDDANFDFLKSMAVYISAEGLEELNIASINAIPSGTKKISLVVEDADLTPYIVGDQITFRTESVTDKLTTQNINISMHSVFRVDAKILGL
jgi:formylmethanofuran dehydrogenase subunit E-like metal-binding protein